MCSCDFYRGMLASYNYHADVVCIGFDETFSTCKFEVDSYLSSVRYHN